MWKSLLAGTAVLALAGTGFSLAQQGPAAPTPPAQTAPQGRVAPNLPGAASDAQAYRDARIAALRAGLALSPEQEKTWPAFERAWRAFLDERAAARDEFRDRMRDRQADRGDRDRMGRDRTDRDRSESDDPLDRLQRFADRASRRAGALKSLADATAPLVNGLDDAQKRRFWLLARPFGPGFGGPGGFDGRDDRGPGGRHGWHHDGRPHGGFHDHGRYGFRGPDRWRDDSFGRDYGRDDYWRDDDGRGAYGQGGPHGYGRDGGYDRNDWRDDGRRDRPSWREGRRDDDRRGYGPSGPSRRSDDRRPLGPMEERL